MNTSMVEIELPAALGVATTEDTLTVDLSDGRTVSVPLAWYPRLLHANAKERSAWRVIGQGHGLHWESIDEDVSVENLLAGHPSGESQQSFEQWLVTRPA